MPLCTARSWLFSLLACLLLTIPGEADRDITVLNRYGAHALPEASSSLKHDAAHASQEDGTGSKRDNLHVSLEAGKAAMMSYASALLQVNDLMDQIKAGDSLKEAGKAAMMSYASALLQVNKLMEQIEAGDSLKRLQAGKAAMMSYASALLQVNKLMEQIKAGDSLKRVHAHDSLADGAGSKRDNLHVSLGAGASLKRVNANASLADGTSQKRDDTNASPKDQVGGFVKPSEDMVQGFTDIGGHIDSFLDRHSESIGKSAEEAGQLAGKVDDSLQDYSDHIGSLTDGLAKLAEDHVAMRKEYRDVLKLKSMKRMTHQDEQLLEAADNAAAELNNDHDLSASDVAENWSRKLEGESEQAEAHSPVPEDDVE